ncbi:MAG: alpha/beta hydrolase [Candidatus Bathyarchaeia archaeon]
MRVKVNDIEIHYELKGKGKTVVFINGLTSDTTSWYYQIQCFLQKYQVLTYDCRGQGQSGRPIQKKYSTKIHANDLNALLGTLGIQKVHLIGLSNGGLIAQKFAFYYPKKLGALVLVSTPAYMDSRLRLITMSWITATKIGGAVLRFDVAMPLIFGRNFLNNKLLLKKLRERCKNLDISANILTSLIKGMEFLSPYQRRKILAPTLVIAGDDDILIPVEHAKALAREIPKAELLILNNCGHNCAIERPEEFNYFVLNFLQRYDNLLSI